MEELPLEVLRQILSYLNFRQRLDAGLVCKRWLYASRELLEDVELEVREGHLPYVTSGRYFTSISVCVTIINDCCVRFLNHHGPLHLKFTHCEVQQSLSTKADCSELLTLEAESSDVLSLFEYYLPSLETLILTYARDVHAEILENSEFIGLGLKSFSMPLYLPDNNGSSQSGQEFLVDPKLIDSSVEKFVRMRAETLKFIEFPINISTQAILSISQVENLKLESVTFPNCKDRGTAIVDFLQKQKSITALELSSSNFSDEDFHKIFDHLPALKEFSVMGSSTLDRFIVRLFARPTMRVIRLFRCDLLTPDSFPAAIETLKCVDLRVLQIVDTQVQESHVRRLLPLLPRLNTLMLSHCPLSNDGFREATLRLTSLRTLDLYECNGLSGHKLGHLTGLVDLSMRNCKGITTEGLLEGVRFPNLKSLRVVCLSPHDMVYSEVEPIKLELIKQNPCLKEDNILIL